jgi:hypothetical protein
MNPFLIFTIVFYVPMILLWIYKYTDKKNGKIVKGKVIDIYPRYRSPEFTIKYTSSEGKTYVQKFRTLGFTTFRMNQLVKLYEIKTTYGFKYKLVVSYYYPIYILFGIPFIAALAFLFQ